MTEILPRHHYCSLHGVDPEHFIFDQYGYARFTYTLDTTQLNNATGIYVDNYTPAATNFDGAHRFSLEQASDWYYKLKGWTFDGSPYYFDYNSFNTRVANLQSGMWVYDGLDHNPPNDPATVGNAHLDSLAANGFWGKHLGFFHQKYQSNGVYDYCPYFHSYGATDQDGNLRYEKQMNHPAYLYDPGEQIIAQAFIGNGFSGTATTTVKEWADYESGGGAVRTTLYTKDFQSSRPAIMYQFTKNNSYDLYQYVVAYGTGQKLSLNQNDIVTNESLTENDYFTNPASFQLQVQSVVDSQSYYVDPDFFDNLDLYTGVDTYAEKVAAAASAKQAFINAGNGVDTGPRLGITNITYQYLQGFSRQEFYYGVPVWKHWTGDADETMLTPIFS